MIDLNDKHLVKIPIEEAIIPIDGMCIVNHWWIVTPDNEIMFYGGDVKYRSKQDGAPQTNIDKNVIEHMKNRLYPTCTIKQIPVVYTGFPRNNNYV